jgi:hypothetical protein
MASTKPGGYLPGDPRYGRSGDALRQYYSEKPAQWVIFAWDRAGQAGARAANIAAQKDYAKALGVWPVCAGILLRELSPQPFYEKLSTAVPCMHRFSRNIPYMPLTYTLKCGGNLRTAPKVLIKFARLWPATSLLS